MTDKTGFPDAEMAGDHDEANLLQHTLPTTRNYFDPESLKLLNAMLPDSQDLHKDLHEEQRVAIDEPARGRLLEHARRDEDRTSTRRPLQARTVISSARLRRVSPATRTRTPLR